MNTRSLIQMITGMFVLFFSCNQLPEKVADPLFQKMDPTATNINFVNQVENTSELNIFKYRNFYNGGGVAIGDINNDGLADVYFTSNMGANKLYLNQGNFTFKDITKSADVAGKNTWSTGAVMVDINADGLLDIYVCNAGNVAGDNQRNELYINQGDLVFEERAEAYNLAESGFTTHAAFFDYDLDGDLDAYILNNSFIPVSALGYNNRRELRSEDWNVPDILKGGGDKLLRNDHGQFKDVSEEAGIYGSLIGFGLGVTVGDINNDRLPDLYISNDFYERDYLYINQGNGTFKEDIENQVAHMSLSSMGADMADINNDGLSDIFVTDMLPESDERVKNTSEFERYDLLEFKRSQGFYNQYMQNSLQLNNGNNTFSEIAYYSGVATTDWSWGALMFDMDNDGYRDIFVSNGIYHDLTNMDFMDFFANDIIQRMVLTGKKEAVDSIINKMPSTPIPNYAFRNNQNLKFDNEAQQWGLDEPSFSNGSAYGDLDNDGDLDLIVNNVNQQAFVYKNLTQERFDKNYVKLKLEGADENPYAVGAKVRAYVDHEILSQELMPSRGFQSSVDYVMTIGLGSRKVDSLEVSWPDGRMEIIADVRLNELTQIKQKSGEMTSSISGQQMTTVLTRLEGGSIKKHQENRYDDFDHEGLIPKMLSREGPTMAKGDLNDDGLEDVFIGGAKGDAAQVYLQTDDQDWKLVESRVFEDNRVYEDVASCLVDVDGDKDLDLIVGSGGNESYRQKQKLPIRVYINRGAGSFSLSLSELPVNYENTSVIAPHDYDNDGDQDLFIGSRSVPGVYGITPKSMLLENDGKGEFGKVSLSNSVLENVGMVTAASWIDVNNDAKKELIAVGEWMAPTCFEYVNGSFQVLETDLDDFAGWWTSMKSEDLDNDGDEDLILGNRGLNTSLQSNELVVFINDFDQNGTIEQIFTYKQGEKHIPIHLKRELISQLSFLKKQNMKFAEYAQKSIEDLFDEETLKSSIIRSAQVGESVVALNDGNGAFRVQPLPGEVQFSCINSIIIKDLNNDENKDLILAGNNYDFKPQFSRLDANYGSVLFGDGQGKFSMVAPEQSGIAIKGQVKDMELIEGNNTTFLVVGINNEQPEIYQINE